MITKTARLLVELEGKGFREGQRHIRETREESERLRRSMGGLASNFAAVGAALGAAFSVREVVQVADNFRLIENQLRNVSSSTGQLRDNMRTALGVANETGAALSGTARLYGNLVQFGGEFVKTQKDALDLTRAINQSAQISGASIQETANASRQLSQALAGGVLRAEEFNSIIEQMPRLARAIEQGLGAAQGQLRGLVNEGVVTSERLVAAIQSQFSVLAAEAEQAKQTVASALSGLSNTVTVELGSRAGGFQDVLVAGINTLTNNLPLVIDLLEAGTAAALSLGTALTFRTAIAALPALGAALSAALGPIGLLTGAIAGLVFFRDEIAEWAFGVKDAGAVVQATIQVLGPKFQELSAWVGAFIRDTATMIGGWVSSSVEMFSNFSAAVAGLFPDGTLERASAMFSGLLSGVIDFGSRSLSFLTQFAETATDILLAPFRLVISGLERLSNSQFVPPELRENLASAAEGFDLLANSIDRVAGREVIDATVQIARQVGGAAAEAGRAMPEIISDIREAAEEATTAVGDSVTEISATVSALASSPEEVSRNIDLVADEIRALQVEREALNALTAQEGEIIRETARLLNQNAAEYREMGGSARALAEADARRVVSLRAEVEATRARQSITQDIADKEALVAAARGGPRELEIAREMLRIRREIVGISVEEARELAIRSTELDRQLRLVTETNREVQSVFRGLFGQNEALWAAFTAMGRIAAENVSTVMKTLFEETSPAFRRLRQVLQAFLRDPLFIFEALGVLSATFAQGALTLAGAVGNISEELARDLAEAVKGIRLPSLPEFEERDPPKRRRRSASILFEDEDGATRGGVDLSTGGGDSGVDPGFVDAVVRNLLQYEQEFKDGLRDSLVRLRDLAELDSSMTRAERRAIARALREQGRRDLISLGTNDIRGGAQLFNPGGLNAGVGDLLSTEQDVLSVLRQQTNELDDRQRAAEGFLRLNEEQGAFFGPFMQNMRESADAFQDRLESRAGNLGQAVAASVAFLAASSTIASDRPDFSIVPTALVQDVETAAAAAPPAEAAAEEERGPSRIGELLGRLAANFEREVAVRGSVVLGRIISGSASTDISTARGVSEQILDVFATTGIPGEFFGRDEPFVTPGGAAASVFGARTGGSLFQAVGLDTNGQASDSQIANQLVSTLVGAGLTAVAGPLAGAVGATVTSGIGSLFSKESNAFGRVFTDELGRVRDSEMKDKIGQQNLGRIRELQRASQDSIGILEELIGGNAGDLSGMLQADNRGFFFALNSMAERTQAIIDADERKSGSSTKSLFENVSVEGFNFFDSQNPDDNVYQPPQFITDPLDPFEPGNFGNGLISQIGEASFVIGGATFPAGLAIQGNVQLTDSATFNVGRQISDAIGPQLAARVAPQIAPQIATQTAAQVRVAAPQIAQNATLALRSSGPVGGGGLIRSSNFTGGGVLANQLAITGLSHEFAFPDDLEDPFDAGFRTPPKFRQPPNYTPPPPPPPPPPATPPKVTPPSTGGAITAPPPDAPGYVVWDPRGFEDFFKFFPPTSQTPTNPPPATNNPPPDPNPNPIDDASARALGLYDGIERNGEIFIRDEIKALNFLILAALDEWEGGSQDLLEIARDLSAAGLDPNDTMEALQLIGPYFDDLEDTQTRYERIVDDMNDAFERAVKITKDVVDTEAALNRARNEQLSLLRKEFEAQLKEENDLRRDAVSLNLGRLRDNIEELSRDARALGMNANAFSSNTFGDFVSNALDDFLKSSLDAVGGFAALTERMDEFTEALNDPAISGGVLAMRAAIERLREEQAEFYNETIADQIDQFERSTERDLRLLLESQETRMREVVETGADIAQAERLAALELNAFFESLNDEALQEIQGFIGIFEEAGVVVGDQLNETADDLRGQLNAFQGFAEEFAGLRTSLEERFVSANARESVDILRDRAVNLLGDLQDGNQSAAQALPQVLNNLVNAARETFGNAREFQDILQFTNDLIDEAELSATQQADAFQAQIDAIEDGNDTLLQIQRVLESGDALAAFFQSARDNGVGTSTELLDLLRSELDLTTGGDNALSDLVSSVGFGLDLNRIINPLVIVQGLMERQTNLQSLTVTTIEAQTNAINERLDRIVELEERIERLQVKQNNTLDEIRQRLSA